MFFLPSLINLSNPISQCFALPKPMILYIFENSTCIPYKKLLKSCKTFKIIQQKSGESKIKSLTTNKIFFADIILDLGENEFFTWKFPTISEFNIDALQIMETLKLGYLRQITANILFSKIDFTKIKKISICFSECQITEDILLKFLQPSLETLRFNCYPFVELDEINPALLAVKRCPNLTKLSITCKRSDQIHICKKWNYFLTKDDFSEILKFKSQTKMNKFVLSPFSEIDPNDFMKFIDERCLLNAEVRIGFTLDFSKNFEALSHYLRDIEKLRNKSYREKVMVTLTLNYDCQENFYWL